MLECELSKAKLSDTVEQIQTQLDVNRKGWLYEQQNRKERRRQWAHEIQMHNKRHDTMLAKIYGQK